MAKETIFLIPLIIVLIFHSVQSYPKEYTDCPLDCICYEEYLSNLESWKWVETDINIQKDDPRHEEFNPYTEHNEVYDNPVLAKKRQREQILSTATCMLRTNDPEEVTDLFAQIKSSVQILSLIQAPGSGLITLEKIHFDDFQQSLIGLELQGYDNNEKSPVQRQPHLQISANAFQSLSKLTYLKLEAVELLKENVEDEEAETKKYKYTYTNDFVDDEQVIIVKARPNIDTILPYNEYKAEESAAAPANPNINIKPKIHVAFTKLQSLKHLRISGSNLQDISWDMFYKLDSLKFLLLDQNELLFLPDFVFYSTPNLTSLSLTRNHILNLQTVGLVGLLTLQKLDVSHNNITHLSELSLPPFPHLEIADFRSNPIENIFPNTFEIMNSTKTLFLGNPDISLELSMNSFFGLISLLRLDIINVRVEFLERGLLKGMPELQSLTMTGMVKRIMYDAFLDVPKLEKLVLKHCSIQKISMDAFLGLNSLIELDLSHNDLSFLPPGIFDQQPSLREIFLQYNSLKTLPSSTFSKIPAKLIRLEGNPWHCSCDMKYWDPKQTNQVKRYHVPLPNATMCDLRYHKGGPCYEGHEANTFEVNYAYEKRVSPICQSPETFKGRSVFEVLRKGLHFCANTLQQNISILLTSTNPTETLEIMGTVKVPKSMEKQLLFPSKIRKPQKNTTTTIGSQQILTTSGWILSNLSSVPSTIPTFTITDLTQTLNETEIIAKPASTVVTITNNSASRIEEDNLDNSINIIPSQLVVNTNKRSKTGETGPRRQFSNKALRYMKERREWLKHLGGSSQG